MADDLPEMTWSQPDENQRLRALPTRERRKAAARAWKCLPGKQRRQAIQLARRGLLHPDPQTRAITGEWANAWLEQWSVVRVIGLVVLAAASVATGTLLFGGTVVAPVIAEAVVAYIVLVTAVAMRRLRRVNRDLSARPATDEELVRLATAGDVRPRWFLRAATMVVGFLLGAPVAVVGVVVVIEGDGSRMVAGIVGLVGAGLFWLAVRAAKAQWRSRKAAQ